MNNRNVDKNIQPNKKLLEEHPFFKNQQGKALRHSVFISLVQLPPTMQMRINKTETTGFHRVDPLTENRTGERGREIVLLIQERSIG